MKEKRCEHLPCKVEVKPTYLIQGMRINYKRFLLFLGVNFSSSQAMSLMQYSSALLNRQMKMVTLLTQFAA